MTVYFPECEIFAVGDRMRLIQVMANLLCNAAKYTQIGGEVTLRVTATETSLVILVLDNGMGMSPSLVTRVFDLFTQADRNSDRSEGGLGIGLSLVRSIIEMHGGSVTAESGGLELGSTFSVHLSRARAPCIKTLPQDVRREPTRIKHSILVVDDNADAADMLTQFFESAGHVVVTEYSSEAALARCATFATNVCVLDIGLPGLDGYGLVKMLRKMPKMANAVMIAITGYGQPEDKKNALAAGFDQHFVKPVEIAKLLAAIDGVTVALGNS